MKHICFGKPSVSDLDKDTATVHTVVINDRSIQSR